MDFPKKQAQRLMPLYLLEYSEKLFENHPNPEAPWGGGGSDYTAGYGIDITNSEISIDQDIVATKNDLNEYIKDNDTNYSAIFRGKGVWVKAEGAYTATSYGDGAIARSIPHQPGYTYDLPNQSGTIALTSDIPSLTNYVTTTQLEDALDDYALKTDIPENVSDLNNDAGYTTQTWVENQGYSKFSGSYNDLTDKPDLSIYAESADLATVATTGDYDDLQNKPNIPVSTSDLINDSGYITKSVNNLDNYTLTSSLAAVATSGSYNDLLDKPTIPSIPVTDVEVNGVSVLSGTVAEVTVPTDTSDLTNSAGFITSSAIPTNVSDFNNDANYVTATTLTAELANYVPSSSITTVAYTGSYNDLTDKPSIPDANLYLIEITGSGTTGTVTTAQANKIQADPSKCILKCWTQTNANPGYFRFYSNSGNNYYYMADLEAGSIDSNGNRNLIKNRLQVNVSTEQVTLSQFRTTPISSSITLGSGLTQTISSSDVRTISIDTSTVAMQSDLTDLVAASSLSTVAFSGDYDDLTDKPTIPTATSDLTNDSGFITGITSGDVTTALGYTPTNPSSLATVATTGDYDDLTNKPTIPDAVSGTNDGTNWTTLTIGNDTYDIPQGGSTPGMIGEVLYDVPNGEAGVNPITMAHSFADYSYVDIQYRCFDNAYEVRSQRIYDPNGKHVYLDWDVLVSGTVYAKKSIYILNGTTMTVKNGTDMQVWYSNGSTVGTQATSTSDYQHQIKITKVVGYKQNNAPIVIPTYYVHNLNLKSSDKSFYATAQIINRSNTAFTLNTLKQWLYNNNFQTTSTGMYPASGAGKTGSTQIPVVAIRCYDINSGFNIIAQKGSNSFELGTPAELVDIVIPM